MKIRLRIGALAVGSFEVAQALADDRGTVRDNESQPRHQSGGVLHAQGELRGHVLVYDTCDGFSCNGTCHSANCTTTVP